MAENSNIEQTLSQLNDLLPTIKQDKELVIYIKSFLATLQALEGETVNAMTRADLVGNFEDIIIALTKEMQDKSDP